MIAVTRMLNGRASQRRSTQLFKLLSEVIRKETGNMDGKGVDVIPLAVEFIKLVKDPMTETDPQPPLASLITPLRKPCE